MPDSAFAAWHRTIRGTTVDLGRFNRRRVTAVRAVDPDTPILVDGWHCVAPQAFDFNEPVDDPAVLYALRHGSPPRIVAAEFWHDRCLPGAAGYLADLLEILDRQGWHWALYAWTGLDYGIAPDWEPDRSYWEAAWRGEDVGGGSEAEGDHAGVGGAAAAARGP